MYPSSWLKQTLNGSKRHSRSIWLIGMLLLVLIAGSIGVGVYFIHTPRPTQAL